MPHIDEKRRTDIDCLNSPPMKEGELSYQISQAIIRYCLGRPKSYKTLNEVMGVLTGTLLSFVFEIVTPYEDRKIGENGNAWQSLIEDWKL